MLEKTRGARKRSIESMADAPFNAPDAAKADNDEADLALLERIASGDRAAFREFYERHYDAVLRFVWRITGRVDSAQEAVNDVMLVVWRRGAAFKRRSKVSTWLMGIAYRKALQGLERRRRWTDRFKQLDPAEWNELSTASEELTRSRETEDWLAHGMQQLSAKQRAVVELTYFHGCSYEEIAAITESPVNTVKTRMFHARAKLRRVLEALERGGRAE